MINLEYLGWFDLKIHTGDNFPDVIVNYYLYLVIKENIDFVVLGKLIEKMPLEMFDITTLMGNILQNAVEAFDDIEKG